MAPRSTALPSAQTESARELRRNFFCELCNKGYARITELESHENSYDHQHRKRMKEMKQITRNPTAAVRANRIEKKRTENAEMISLNLEKGKAGGERRGFRDIGEVKVPEVKEKVEVETRIEEIRVPVPWEDLGRLGEKVDVGAFPAGWLDADTPTQQYLDSVSTAEARKAYFEDDDEVLDELGIGDDMWATVSEPGQAGEDVELDDDWEDFMQTDEWKAQRNEKEALRREKIVKAWRQRQLVA